MAGTLPEKSDEAKVTPEKVENREGLGTDLDVDKCLERSYYLLTGIKEMIKSDNEEIQELAGFEYKRSIKVSK